MQLAVTCPVCQETVRQHREVFEHRHPLPQTEAMVSHPLSIVELQKTAQSLRWQLSKLPQRQWRQEQRRQYGGEGARR
jgi:hypothetical protein